MKIINICEYEIRFDNDKCIEFDHFRNCCENNYADFPYLKEELGGSIFDIDFQEPLTFEGCDYGFRFGNDDNMFFVPCYSSQNGYYSRDVDIYYDDERVLNCEGGLV